LSVDILEILYIQIWQTLLIWHHLLYACILPEKSRHHELKIRNKRVKNLKTINVSVSVILSIESGQEDIITTHPGH
jgi:hypothetical protein